MNQARPLHLPSIKPFIPFIALGVALGLPVAAFGQDAVPPGPGLRLRDALQTALLHNRNLQIERINPEVARMTLRGSWGWYDPLFTTQVRRENVTDSGAFDPTNPGVETGFSSESDLANMGLFGYLPSGLTYNLAGSYGQSSGERNFLNFDSYRVSAGIYLQQPLLRNMWIDLPRLSIRVNKRNLTITEQGVRFVAMDVMNSVQQGYYDLLFAWESLRVQQELLTARKQLLRNTQRLIEVGTLTVLEERVAASQVARVETDLISASNTVALAGNNLKTLMGIAGSDWTQDLIVPADRLIVTANAFNLNDSWERGLNQRPDLIQLVVSLEKAELNLKFYRNQLFPGLDLIGSYGRRGATSVQAFPPDKPRASASEALDQFKDGVAPSDMIGVLFTLPLTRTLERANYRSGKYQKRQAELLVDQKKELVLREISDAMHAARFSLDRFQSARHAVEFSESALKAEEEKLAGGKSSLNFVLLFQADFASAKTAEIQARQVYNKAISALHFAEGTILERNNIQFEFQ
jgi:outer membrane protein TolC